MKRSISILETEAELRQKLVTGSHDPQVYCSLADVVFSAGRVEEAVSLYQQALKLPLTESQKARVSVELGWLYYEIGKETLALCLASAAAETIWKESETPEVWAWRGAAESLRAHCISFADEKAGADGARLALDCLNKVMIEAPNFDDIAGVYYDAARLSILLWNAKDAIEFCDKCLGHELSERERLQCLVVLVEALRYEERFADAEKVLEEAFTLAKNETAALPRLYMEMGMLKRLTYRPDEAQHSFEQALSALESHPYSQDDPHVLTLVYRNLGEMYYESGKYKEAINAFQKVIDHRPNDDSDHRSALVWLGQSYHAAENYAKARDCYEEVFASPLSSEEERASVQAGLGKVCYEDGQYTNAIDAFEAVIAKVPEDDEFHWNAMLWLGCSYEASGSDAKAGDCFEKVLRSRHASSADQDSAKQGLSRLPPSTKKTWH